jgi:hypothetical protein
MGRFDFNQLLELLNSDSPSETDARQPHETDEWLAGDPGTNRFANHIAEAMLKARPPFAQDH